MIFLIARIITALLLVCALAELPYSYYTLLRFIVFIVSAYGVYVTIELQKTKWTITFIVIALLFNPFLPIYLDKAIWGFIDIVVAIIFIVSIFSIKNDKT